MGGGLAKLVVRAEVPSALGQGVSPLRAAPLGALVVLVDDALVLLDVPPPPLKAAIWPAVGLRRRLTLS